MRLSRAVGFFLLISINTGITSGKSVKKLKATTSSPLDVPPEQPQDHSSDADFEELLSLYNSENSGNLMAFEVDDGLNEADKLERPLDDASSSSVSSSASSESGSGVVNETASQPQHPFVNPWQYPSTNSSVHPANKSGIIDGDAFFGEWVPSNGSAPRQKAFILPPLTKPYTQPVLQIDKIPENAELRYVMAFWRHGERNPLKTYRGDPYEKEYTAGGWGQLTVNGITQLESVGRRTRHRYTTAIPFLSQNLTASEVYITSTNVDRALISAQAFIVGFASPAAIPVPDSPTWPKGFIPIPIHAESGEIFYGPWGMPCKRYKQLKERVSKSAWYHDIERRAQPIISEIAEKIGVRPTLSNLDYFMENIAMTHAMGRPVPDWVAPYQVMLEDIFNAQYRLSFGFFGINEAAFDFAHEFGMLTSGTIGRYIVDSLRERVLAGQAGVDSSYKFFGLSGHDVSIASVMRALGLPDIPDSRPATYGATLAIELWHSNELVSRGTDGGYFVKVVYYPNSTVDEPLDLSPMILGCSDGKCPLEVLTQNAYRLIPEPSFEKFCATDIDVKPVSSGNRNGIILSFVITLFVAFIV
uniref:2-phosphoxylose phosphatase 1 n=1 Tax=Panagrellus redivivus TaxID=6233 RepID=A0A7E4W6B3_PANRE